jgi:NitT/TauT family transport system permease protein
VIRDLVTPNRQVPAHVDRAVIVAEVLAAAAIWSLSPFTFLPGPLATARALADLWLNQGLGAELITSVSLNVEALALATLISLGLAYAAQLAVVRPAVTLISKLRFLSMTGLTFFFTLMAASGHALKLDILVFSITVFFVTGMSGVVAAIPREQFDLARTLRMGEWRVLWEVVVLGQADQAFEVMRQNAAMGWMMLTLVEGVSRTEGGIGAMLLDENKHFNLAAVMAIMLVVITAGVAQDWMIACGRRMFCPWATLQTERR